MLQTLTIQNYAIIDELQVQFGTNLNIITGETGAGKSILMGALDMVLGKRADTSVLKNNNKKCFVEAVFTAIHKNDLKFFFEENDIDLLDEVIVRREITPNGKSRSFINDSPVNVATVKALGGLMVDLHRQFDTAEIESENFQRQVLDSLAGHENLLHDLKLLFTEITSHKKTITQLKEAQEAANKEADYNTFLFEELEKLQLKPNELETLDEELALLSNAEQIKAQLGAIHQPLLQGDMPVVQFLKQAINKLGAISNISSNLTSLQSRLNEVYIELKDIADELEKADEATVHNPKRIDEINERIAIGYKLQKKHNVTTTAELMDLQEALSQKLQSSVQLQQQIAVLGKELETKLNTAEKIAQQLSKNRQAVTDNLCIKITEILGKVGMPNAALKISITPTTLHAYGVDEVSFLFDANKTGKYEPIHKVASGGELSRLMLAVKYLVAKHIKLPVLVFDEIDTGISGEAAKQVGSIMKGLAQNQQIIAITHLPQTASQADAHFFVYKEEANKTIATKIKQLSNNERIEVIAQMLSGENPTESARNNAKELISMQ
jgi:DNA repair protein RecN (Recombination protein N)